MPFLVRAINREYWPEPDERDIKARVLELNSDALNDFFKTSDNKMSFWYAEDNTDVDEAILAYLGSMDKWVVMEKRGEFERQEFILLPEDKIPSGIEIQKNPNHTYIKDYEIRHRDLANLNVRLINELAALFIKTLDNNNGMKAVSKTHIKSMFIKAVKENKITSSNIPKSDNGALRKYISAIEEEIESTKKAM